MVEGYVGSVEAQGHGTLHLHMLLWLRGALTPLKMRGLLQTKGFKHQWTFFCINLRQSETAILESENGELVLHNQLKDYSERGRELEDYSFLDFLLNTYPERKCMDNLWNQRVHFIEGSGCECQAQVVHLPGHEILPSFLGSWFARNDDAQDRERPLLHINDGPSNALAKVVENQRGII